MSETFPNNIVITGVESVTPIGLNMAQTATSIRAGISLVTSHPYYSPILREETVDDPYFLSASFCNSMQDDQFGWQRLSEMLVAPIHELIEKSELTRAELEETALWICLPYNDPVIAELNLQSFFLDEIKRQFSLSKSVNIMSAQMGVIGPYYAIREASKQLAAGDIRYAVICSVDSYLIDKRLAYYDVHWRLKTDRNPYGFVAGEAASVFMLETENNTQKTNKKILAKIDALAFGKEENTILGDKSSTGLGFSSAIEALTDSLGEQELKWVVSDLNGESYKAFEWGIINSRHLNIFDDGLTMDHCAEYVGDVGSAFLGVNLGSICHAFEHGYGVDSKALVISGNDAGYRAVMLVNAPDDIKEK